MGNGLFTPEGMVRLPVSYLLSPLLAQRKRTRQKTSHDMPPQIIPRLGARMANESRL
jgi:hypothetical protein